MDVNKINDAIIMLETQKEQFEEDIKTVFYTLKLIKESSFENVAYDNTYLEKSAAILYMYGYNNFMESSITYDDYEKIFKKICGKLYKMFLSDLRMDDKNEYITPESFSSMMQKLCKSKSFLVKMDNNRKTKGTDRKSDILHGDSLTQKLIEEPKNKFISASNNFLAKYKNIVLDISLLINLLTEIMCINYEKNFEKFKLTCHEIFKLLKKNHFQDVIFEDIKRDLRSIIKKQEEKITELANSHAVTEEIDIKIGSRTNRISTYEKSKLKQKIKESKSKLSSEDKLWVDIVVDQLLIMEGEFLDDFRCNYVSYLPVDNKNIKDIINLAILELKYKDANDEVIDIMESANKSYTKSGKVF